MILFCDTSALVKLYVREVFTDEMLAAAAAASALAVCRIAWAEAMAALARRSRESPADADVIATVRGRLGADWGDYAIVEITQALVELLVTMQTPLRCAPTTASNLPQRAPSPTQVANRSSSPASIAG